MVAFGDFSREENARLARNFNAYYVTALEWRLGRPKETWRRIIEEERRVYE